MNVERLGLGVTHVDYRQAWQIQREIHAEVVAGTRSDTMLLLEHASVYTAGRRTSRTERPRGGPEIIDVDRGGRITWHGPGQLVVYPILALREPVDVVAYVRALERAVIATAAQWGVTAGQVPGRSGVWVPGRPESKLAAVGVRVARGVTMHGVAINVDPDLTGFSQIVPCGIDDAGVTSLSAQTGRAIGVVDVADVATGHLLAELAPLAAQRHTEPTANHAPA